jgi:glycosyltransferase involved in cell wall biosynthesis
VQATQASQTPVSIGEVAVIIPALNESMTIASLISDLLELGVSEVIVVNDFSDDETATLSKKLGATVLNLADNLGAWGATQAGIHYAIQKKHTYVLTMDGDGQHLASEINKMIGHQQTTNANVVVGAHPQRASAARKVAWAIVKFVSGISVGDLTSGFKLYDSAAQFFLADESLALIDYQDVGVLLHLKVSGLTISEVPTRMAPRKAGPSRIFRNWLIVAHYMASSIILGISKRRLKNPPAVKL